MNALLMTALTPVVIALAVVAVSALVCTVLGKAIHHADQDEAQPAPRRFDPFADYELGSDDADVRRSPSTEACARQALALDGPTPEFIADTRRVVVAEARRLRSVPR